MFWKWLEDKQKRRKNLYTAWWRCGLLNWNVAARVWKTTPVREGQSPSPYRIPFPRFMISSWQTDEYYIATELDTFQDCIHAVIQNELHLSKVSAFCFRNPILLIWFPLTTTCSLKGTKNNNNKQTKNTLIFGHYFARDNDVMKYVDHLLTTMASSTQKIRVCSMTCVRRGLCWIVTQFDFIKLTGSILFHGIINHPPPTQTHTADSRFTWSLYQRMTPYCDFLCQPPVSLNIQKTSAIERHEVFIKTLKNRIPTVKCNACTLFVHMNEGNVFVIIVII